MRGFRGQFDHAPDVVAFPRDAGEVEALLDWCAERGAAAIPYGGGTSVVGGVEAAIGDGYAGAVTIDLGRLDRVLEVDRESRAALIQAGATGPELEDQLREHDLTLRHFPQSFQLSTLGGWIATRAGGHFATLYTHIDDLVESITAVTPSGTIETRRLPGSGAGPEPGPDADRLRGHPRRDHRGVGAPPGPPAHKASAAVTFPDFERGAEAVRALGQSGLYPANCRLLDPGEAALTGRRRRTVRCSCSDSSRRTIPSTPGWIGRSSWFADHGGNGGAPRRRRGDGEGLGRRAGGRSFCARRTCATRSSPAA